jgi:hypothetical protein
VTATGEPPRGPAGGDQAQKLDMPGLDEALRHDLDERIREFEALHQQDVMRGGEGWVPRIRRVDYAIAIAVNVLIVLWLVVVLVGGE